MEHLNVVHKVGDATVTKISELALDAVPASFLYPGSDEDVAAEEGRKLGAGSFDPTTGLLRLSVHCWLVRTPGRVALVDSATGNGRDLPGNPPLNHLNEPFLERLEAAGVRPEQVDAVLHTHIHADHVGWNTHQVGGRWVPTFPNAQHIFSGREREYNAALAAGDGSDAAVRAEAGLGRMMGLPEPGVYEASMVPVIDAGLTREIVVDGTEVIEGFSYLPSPGHSIDHASIGFTSRGERALFWGDVLHSPVQLALPDWNSVYCEFPDAARKARRWAMGHAADAGALVFTTHFAESSAGRVAREGERFTWRFT